MPIYQLGDKKPVIPASCYISEEATLIGAVILGENVSILPGAVLRADNEPITIGDGSNVQDGSVLHTDPGCPLVLGKGVTIGHCVMLHGCTIGDGSLIGVGAGPVDFYLSTGRMPLDNPRDEPQRNPPRYSRLEMDALIAFITKIGGGPPAPAADPGRGDLAVGFHVFSDHCAGCHQAVGRGGLVLGAVVPSASAATWRTGW